MTRPIGTPPWRYLTMSLAGLVLASAVAVSSAAMARQVGGSTSNKSGLSTSQTYDYFQIIADLTCSESSCEAEILSTGDRERMLIVKAICYAFSSNYSVIMEAFLSYPRGDDVSQLDLGLDYDHTVYQGGGTHHVLSRDTSFAVGRDRTVKAVLMSREHDSLDRAYCFVAGKRGSGPIPR